MEATLVQVARRSGSLVACRSRSTPTNAIIMTADEVRRGSQVHQVPQVGRAKVEPVTSSRPHSTTPTSTEASTAR
jgi:hypothetical protein